MSGKVRKMRATESTTLQAFNAAANPCWPWDAETMTAGMMDSDLVNSLLKKGLILQSNAPSQTSWPAMVHTIPALTPEKRSAQANKVPDAWPIVLTKRRYTAGRSAFAASALNELADSIRIALLINNVTTKRDMQSSAMEYDMQLLMAESVGR